VLAAAFDKPSERALDIVRESLVVEDRGRRRLTGRHHLTLSAARVEDVAEVAAVAEQVAARHRPFPLTLSQYGDFGHVVWIGPRRTRALTRLHRDAWQSLVDAGWPPAFAGQSEPSAWVPHCTLVRGWLAERPAGDPVEVQVTELITIIVGRGAKARAALSRP
jgi:2'-5' RNA ligase